MIIMSAHGSQTVSFKETSIFSFSRYTVVRQEYNIYLWGPIIVIFKFNTSKEVCIGYSAI